MAAAQFRYEAFLSYSHADARWANWLHRAIETYRIPKHLAASAAAPKLSPIFRDREELPSASNLDRKIEEALRGSRRLIVICSPRAAQSRWVNEEIARFKALGRGEQIYCLIVDGEPHAVRCGVASEAECFPPALLVGDGMSEPIAADVRDGRDGRTLAKLKVIAGMLGVGLDELRRRDLQRRNRRLVWISAASLAAVLVATALAGYAWMARNEAEASRLKAEREAETARRTTGFMVRLFDVVDPGEARGRSVTAYEILERGVGNIHRDLDGQPEVQATLLETMGKVFTGLGLYRRAIELLEEALHARGAATTQQTAATQVALGDALYQQGEYEEAAQRYREVVAALQDQPWSDERSSAANGVADVLTQNGDYAEAIAMYNETLARDLAAWGASDVHAARTSNELATAQLYAGNYKEAEASYRRSLDIYRTALGADHPKIAEITNDLGSVRYFAGDAAGAAEYYRQALPLYRKLYGDVHTGVATILNNLGRIELERRNTKAALPLLEESVAIDRKLGLGEHDDFVFSLNSLALAHRAEGDAADAERLYQEAAALAERSQHRLWGPILVNEVDLRCAAGRSDGTAGVLDDAAAKIQKSYPDEPWQTAILDSVRGQCLSVSGETTAAEALLLQSLPVIEAKWGKASLFSYDARTRVAEHYKRTGNPVAARRYRTG